MDCFFDIDGFLYHTNLFKFHRIPFFGCQSYLLYSQSAVWQVLTLMWSVSPGLSFVSLGDYAEVVDLFGAGFMQGGSRRSSPPPPYTLPSHPPSTIWCRCCLFSVFLALLSKIRCLEEPILTAGSSILFHRSVCLLSFQYHAAFIIMAL